MKTRLHKLVAFLVVSLLGLFAFTASAVNLKGGEVLYLQPNGDWKQSNARFAAYFCNGTATATWVNMTKVCDDVYEVKVPTPSNSKNHKNVIFCRMNPSSSTNNWNNKWNQTVDLTYDGTKNLFTVTDPWGNDSNGKKATGSWSATATYIAGNGANSKWCNGVEWKGDDSKNKLVDGKITFVGIPAGEYEFKIVDKNCWYGYTTNFKSGNSTQSNFISYINTADDNVKITTTTCSDITVNFNSTSKEITVNATFYEPNYVLMGVGGDWTTGIALQENPNNADELVLLHQPISKANDAIKVVKKTPCGDEFCAAVSAATTVPYTGGGSGSGVPNIVLEDGTYNFYFNKTTGVIRIDGTLDDAKLVYLDPVVYNTNNPGTWVSDNARIALYAYQSNDGPKNLWVTAIRCGEIYYAYLPNEYDRYIWCRMNPAKDENRWDESSNNKEYVWNQTDDISYSAENLLTKLTGWGQANHMQEPYTGSCGVNYDDLDCNFPTIEGDTVYVTINQFVESDPCNYLFESFEQAFAVLKNNTEICTATPEYYGSFKQDAITLNKPVVMQVVFGPEPYVGTEAVGMSGGHINNAPAIFIRNINKDGEGAPLIIRTADAKGNRAVLVHPVIRRSTNVTLDNLDIISSSALRDNALDIDTGEGDENLEGLNKDFNTVPLSTITHNITLKNCLVESYGRNGIHVVGIKGIHVENNAFYTKYDFSVNQTEGEDVVDWGGTIKFINTTDVKFLRNNSEGTLATSFFIQGCQRVLLMNNVFWNNNEVQVSQLSEKGRTVANVRLVNYGEKASEFPLKNIGIYYNTFFIKNNPSIDLADSYVKFDFFRLGGLKQAVDENNKGNFDPTTIRFQYNNCYSYDEDIKGNNDVYNEDTKVTYYLQGIGQDANWCQCFRYNNFWSEYDKALESKNPNHVSSTFELGKYCTGDKETYNAYVNVRNQVCQTDPTDPSALVVKGGSLNIGTVITNDVSLQGADTIFTDRLNGNTENPIRPTIVVDNSNESLSPSDHIYKEPGTIHFYTTPIVGSQTTDVHVSSVALTKNSKVYLSIVDGDVSYFAITDGAGKPFPSDNNGMYLTTDAAGSLDNYPIYVTFKRPTGQIKDATFSAYLQILPASDNALKMLIPLKGHNIVEIQPIKGAWTVGAFQQREVQPVDTIIWRGTSSNDWDDRNNWYKTDGTLVTCLDALTENLTVIIPRKDSERFVTPANGITTYPKLPKISNEHDFGEVRTDAHNGEQVNAGPNDAKETTKVANKIYMEYGASLVGVEELNSGGRERYAEVEQEFIARRNTWLLAGAVVRPWELDDEGNIVVKDGKKQTRLACSRDYYRWHVPQVYMHEATVDATTNTITWGVEFPDLDIPLPQDEAYAIHIPDEYGPYYLPASVYNSENGTNYNPNDPITFQFKGRFYNDSKLPEYTVKSGKPVLLSNTYPANIDAVKMHKANKGTVQVYSYNDQSFNMVDDATQEAVIQAQHSFVFTSASSSTLSISKDWLLNTEVTHRSAEEEMPYVRVEMRNVAKKTASNVYLAFDEFKEDVADLTVDAPKLFAGQTRSLPDVYVKRYGANWSGVHVPTTQQAIPLGVQVRQKNQVFTFGLVRSNIVGRILLEDRLTETVTDLSTDTYSVSGLPVGTCEGRFYLSVEPSEEEFVPDEVPTDIEAIGSDAHQIDIYTNENNVMVGTNDGNELQTIVVTDVAGRSQIYNVSGRYVTLSLPVATGIYTIRVVADNAVRTEKIYLNK